MGIRRRRKKLTSLLSDTDRRIRATTLRRVRRKPATPPADVKEEQETTSPPPPIGTVISETPPDQWAKIIGGYYYSQDLTGGLAQVEIFLAEAIPFPVGSTLYVSGLEVKWNQTKGGRTYSGSFRPNTSATSTNQRVVLKYGLLPRSASYTNGPPSYTNATPPPGSLYSMVYTVANKSEVPRIQEISFRGQVASYSATTTTGTITFTSAHHFVTGHILDISDLPAPFRDVDGIIQVASVPSATQVSFTYSKPLATAISSTTPSTPSYANAVVSVYTATGSSYISPATKQVYVWDGLRWIGYTEALEEGLLVDDGVPPAAPTGLNLTSVGYAEEGALGKVSKSSVELSWTAPTENSSGGGLNDLAGYRIWYSTVAATGPWFGKENFGLETTQNIIGLAPEIKYYFKVIAFDTYGLDSVGLDGEIVTEKAVLSVQTPSAPVVTARLGTVKVKWDGKDYEGEDTPLSLLAYVDVHSSKSDGFTPSEDTLIGKIFGGAGFFVATELDYNVDYYFKLVAVDIHKRSTNPSVQATAKVIPLVNADLIAAELNSPLSVWPFAPATVTAGSLATGSINASNLFGAGVVVQNAIGAEAIGTSQLAANAVTAGKIEAGAITTVKLDALAVTADKIAANTITADKINVGYVYAGAISADQITAGNLSGDRISGGTITGTTIQTSSFGQRLILGGTTLSFYDSSGSFGGRLVQGRDGVPSIEVTSPSNTNYLAVHDGVAKLVSQGASVSVFDSTAFILGSSVLISGRATFGGANPGSSDIGMPSLPTNSSAANMRVGTESLGTIFRSTASSRAFKNSIVPIIEQPELDPKKLLQIPVVAFKYNTDYLGAEDIRFNKMIPGFIAEEIKEIYEIAVEQDGGDATDWNPRYVIPGMLALVQELYQRIQTLENGAN